MSTDRIRALNDSFRKSFIGGRVFITEGVRALGPDFEGRCVEQVQTHSHFGEGDDPYNEHDFGAFRVSDRKCLWKIDYYDAVMEWGSENPADPAQTTRVLTIMLAEEY